MIKTLNKEVIMKLISFIVYFNKKTGKIEKVYDNFANEVDGKIEVIHLGHYYLRQILDKKGIKQSDYMILGVFSEDEYGNAVMNNMRYQTGTFVNNQAVMDIAKKEGKTIMEEKQYTFKMKKGEIEIELTSTDEEFIKEQLETWRNQLLK